MSAIPISFQSTSSGSIRLPAYRQDLTLQVASRGVDGAPYWNLYDPVRNRFFRIGWLEFMLLSHWQQSSTVDTLCEKVMEESPLQPTCDDVLCLLRFLEQNELLRATSVSHRNNLRQMSKARQLSVGQWLLHHYLFFRIPLFKPERFLNATQIWFEHLCQPYLLKCIALLGLIGVWRVIDQWQAFSQTFLYFFSWQGALCYGIALALSKFLHELGHAYMARRYGLRVPTMGIAIMMLWPLLYTDTSEGWKLTSRKARLKIDSAGIIAELILASIAALLWSVLPEGPLKSAAYVLAAVTWISTLAINLNPFMRFDGYYLLMDAIDMPNLHERSFAFGRWYLRRYLLGWHTPIPESEYSERGGLLAIYAYITWLYRLILFTGIAATVYYFFFKLAGIILFAVEIGWFVVRPIYKETKTWSKNRLQWLDQRNAFFSSLGLAAILIACAVPWHIAVRGDGYLQASQHTRLFPPNAARIKTILVQEGQAVQKGQPLFLLEAPDIEAQLRSVNSRIIGLQSQLSGAVGQASLFEQTHVLQQELAAAKASQKQYQEEQARLVFVAPHDGIVRDLDTGLYQGIWVGQKYMLARLVKQQHSEAQVFINENDVTRIKAGASVRILLRRADTRAIHGVVTNIDQTTTHVLTEPLLASINGGPIAVRKGPNGELIPNEARYRISVKINESIANEQLSAVSVYIEGEKQSLLLNLFRQLSSVIIRESGL